MCGRSRRDEGAKRRMFKFSVEDLLANSITDRSGVCELMDYSAMVFVD
jgi:hypothetical protein